MKLENTQIDDLRKIREFYKKIGSSGFNVQRRTFKELGRFRSVENLLGNLLFNEYIDVKAVNACGENLLYWLCQHYCGDDLARLVKLVCSYGADVNFCHPVNGFNPLMAALNRSNRFTVSGETLVDVASTLVEYGLNVNHTDVLDRDAIHMILESKDFDVRSTENLIKILMSLLNVRATHLFTAPIGLSERLVRSICL